MRSFYLVLLIAALGSCSTTKPTTQPVPIDSTKPVEARIIFGFSSSGLGSRPSDGIRLDSSGQMTFITRVRVSGEDFKAISGMAFLEDRDYEQLNSIVRRGNLTMIDSTDIGVKCSQGQGEMMSLVIRRIGQMQTMNLVFDECSASDYNLLLEPQRSAFKDLINWFNYVRAKYRPLKP